VCKGALIIYNMTLRGRRDTLKLDFERVGGACIGEFARRAHVKITHEYSFSAKLKPV
jgi:hypothetical protein